MNKVYRFLFVLSFLLVGFSVFYYLVIYIPARDKQKAANESLQQFHNELQVSTEQNNLNKCLVLASQLEQKNWDSECTNNGLGNNCQLSQSIADSILSGYKTDQDYCYKAFPVH